jgi:AcrR family transcriptional regulator
MVARKTQARSVRPAKAGGRRRRNGQGAPDRHAASRAAALDAFPARGFAAARLDDVARRAGVAKGTIYLYFRDNEALFQDLVRSVIGPLIARFEATAEIDLPARIVAERIVDMFVREVYGTRRKDVIRLIIAEGPRFPKLAEFYYREVISRVIAVVRGVLKRAAARGDIGADALARFPQLLVAPGVVAIVWNGLFDRFEPLDVAALMRAHLNLLFGERRPQ